jgi:hypothetical protein
MGAGIRLGGTGRAAAVIAAPVIGGVPQTAVSLTAWLAMGLVAWLVVSVAVTLALGATIRRREAGEHGGGTPPWRCASHACQTGCSNRPPCADART